MYDSLAKKKHIPVRYNSCYWWELNLASWTKSPLQTQYLKFGSLVQDRHMYIIKRVRNSVDFDLAIVKVDQQSAKFISLPNFPIKFHD